MPNLNFDPFPVLITNRLVLRQLIEEDAAELFLLRTDPEVNKFIDRPKTNSINEAISFIHKINDGISKCECWYWAISLKNTSSLVGTICCWNVNEENQSAEIGFELSTGYQGKGIMQEALRVIIGFCFKNLQLKMITAFTHFANEKSIKLLKKNNFSRNEKLEQEILQVHDNFQIYVLSKTNQ